MPMSPYSEAFYLPDALHVARRLLGARLIHRAAGRALAGLILETEAYMGESDLACHARAGRTARTEVMYGPPGRAYVYFIYGAHWMFNVVTGAAGDPAAVLVRAILPDETTRAFAAMRIKTPIRALVDGPARVCMALQIDGSLNGANLTDPASPLVITPGEAVPEESIRIGPRVGIQYVPEPWRSKPWRLRVDLAAWQPKNKSWEA